MNSDSIQSTFTYRPWGFFENIKQDEGFQIKRIVVNPKQRLSLQYHNQRSEHWIVVRGSIITDIGEDKKTLFTNDSLYIPKGVKHRIQNVCDDVAVLIEVQVGNYLGEDDIVRLEDDYGRL